MEMTIRNQWAAIAILETLWKDLKHKSFLMKYSQKNRDQSATSEKGLTTGNPRFTNITLPMLVIHGS